MGPGPPPGADVGGAVGAGAGEGDGSGSTRGGGGIGSGTSAVCVGGGGSRGGAAAPDLASRSGCIGPVASHTAKPPRPTNTITARGANSRADARRTMSQAAKPAGKAIAGPHHSNGKAPERASVTVEPNANTKAAQRARNSRHPVTTLSQRGADPAFVGAFDVAIMGNTYRLGGGPEFLSCRPRVKYGACWYLSRVTGSRRPSIPHRPEYSFLTASRNDRICAGDLR